MNSIRYRIAGLVFLSITVTVVILVFLANYQMMLHFETYLFMQGLHGGGQEEAYLNNIHDSLFWVGAVMVFFGLGFSFFLAKGITEPLRRLGKAAEGIAAGRYGETVPVEQKDEIGQLAETFNHMSLSLKEAVQLRQRFLADAAHELRTPLAVIQGNLEGMLDGIVPADEKTLSSLREEALHLNRLIQDLRELSLAETGQLPLVKEEVKLHVLAARAVGMLQPLAEEKQVVLQAEAAEVPALRLDSQRMNQIIYNLLTNALRHTPPGGRVTVAVRQEESDVLLAVSDTGEGIAPEHLPYIFEHFYRVDASRDRRSGGSGIGLAIVRRLVEAQRGKVTVQSRLGEGSCFEVRFKRRE